MTSDSPPAISRMRFDETVLRPVPVDQSIVLGGSPSWEMAILWRSADNTKIVGVFRGTPGRFRYGHSGEETVIIHSGRMIITADDGSAEECSGGDIVTLRSGTDYIFDIRETLEETFVITSASGVDF